MAWLETLKARNLSSSSIKLQLSAIRKLAREAAYSNAISYETMNSIVAIAGVKMLGIRAGNWLSITDAQKLLNAPDPYTPKGIRDRMIIALLVGAGLRRDELSHLRLEDIVLREGRWVILDLCDKGGRIRTVPLPGWVKMAVDSWTVIAKLQQGFLCLELRRGGHFTGRAMNAQAIRNLIVRYGVMLKLHIAPHDLRRTFAHLAFENHAALEQIQITLGHSSIQTTEKYLGIRQNLKSAPCDSIPLC